MKTGFVYLSHVALLVSSVERTAEGLREFGFRIGDAEEWDGEGTKEIYVEKDRPNSLLLMEPIKPGAYRRAMDKRGPGLHHLAVDVVDLEEFLSGLSGSGWLLHPKSIETISRTRTAYLCRPGFPALIEAQERKEGVESSPFVTRVEIPFAETMKPMLTAIGLEKTVFPVSEGASITLEDRRILLSALIK